jgi:aspartokinase
MSEIEAIELDEATIDDSFSALNFQNVRFGKGYCFDSVSSILMEFNNIEINFSEIVYSDHQANDGERDLFISFPSEYLGKVREHIEKHPHWGGCSASLIEKVRLLRVSGSGFARSHDFLQTIYSSLATSNINIYAQMCSDVEVLIYCSSVNLDREIGQAMNSMGIPYRWILE